MDLTLQVYCDKTRKNTSGLALGWLEVLWSGCHTDSQLSHCPLQKMIQHTTDGQDTSNYVDTMLESKCSEALWN
ncbi:hypothetical protein PHMEG_00036989 [Phytophthora megakarya]|uniref:Uncharacterized protein n=1 Tax=Phytophthora megakarya TaxID=4795 RepID=A0A225ULZ3_9STRA|nr:hypothetical protein PHMEG_00036989 [Phytophthora megakarya]